jgi:CRP/FNR family cyclic AMP-dependent transcriptional regulator
LLGVLSRRLHSANRRIESLARLDVASRVAQHLVEMGDQFGEDDDDGALRISVRLTQSQLADLVGASRERVNQVVVGLKSQGLITVDRNQYVTLLDRDRLRMRAGLADQAQRVPVWIGHSAEPNELSLLMA